MTKNYTDNVRENCVVARFQRQGQTPQKTFSVKEYGSWPKARRAAAAWVKAIEPTLPAIETSKDRMTRRNQSGVVGVYLDGSATRKNGILYTHWRWVAFWPGCPITRGLSWGTSKYGEDAAFVLAVLARRHESVDRDALYAEYSGIKNTPEVQAILALKNVESA